MADKPVWSLEQVIANLIRMGAKWPSEIPYSFVLPEPAKTSQTGFTELERAWAREALALISDIVEARFVEVEGEGQSSQPTMRIGWDAQMNAAGIAMISAVRPPVGVGEIVQADIWIYPATSQVSMGPRGGGFATLLHEVLHGLGISHPGQYRSAGPIYSEDAQYLQDSRQYTLMSYFEAGFTGAHHFGDGGAVARAAHPLLHDIAALQALYGANNATRADDTVYGFNSTAGRESFDFSRLPNPVIAIWDAGGNDTLDLSGTNVPTYLDLNAGAFSNALSMTKNISIAYGVTIENARGGSGADSIVGNAVGNRLEGGAGDDVLDGRGGWDTAVYSGRKDDYGVVRNDDGTYAVTDKRAGAPDGQDRLTDIEKLQFADGATVLNPASVPAVIVTATEAVLRGGEDFQQALAVQVSEGVLTEAEAVEMVIEAADGTTSVASLAYQFFTGKTPSGGGLDYLVAADGPNPQSLDSTYYGAFNLENRYINFAVNLGRDGEGKAAFAQKYGSLNLMDAGREAYRAIFGAAPTDSKLHDLIDSRAGYFESLGGAGIGAKAAMVGWLLAEAVKADVGVMARSNAAWLADLADGAPSRGYAVDLLDPANGYYRTDFIFGG
ncbi:M10 family metallopeptidase C-terminal domain-containing protein [Caulobacter sp. NIBR2454]|uniref:M10 family metallopeptidase C-terminal domain-containing protein n=1 Tax=Caulobacter sp. NIBR2454 TaxID=3015996 RepID=UPI0022B71F35|nr:M10 family metallopeptidase C-terminal domain-containing protein [Caulobacter sp. NIBR2454]